MPMAAEDIVQLVAQGIAGLAKDFTKTASKSAIKATSEGGSGQLFKWVAWFTGSKNAMKGLGFFLGGVLLQVLDFRMSLWLMAFMLALVLVGEGEVLDRSLRDAGLEPVSLGPKEGLALINGTQVSTAVLALALTGAERLSRAADITAALSIDALLGSLHPFDARIHEPRAFAGQAAAADNYVNVAERLKGIPGVVRVTPQ